MNPPSMRSTELAPSGRDASGRFLPGNQDAVVSGSRSRAVQNALASVVRELVEQVTADLGGDVSATLGRLVTAFAETSQLRAAVFERMAGAPTTAKGHSRRLLAAYLQLVDRETRLALALGLERRARRVPTVSEALAAVDGGAV